VLVADRERADDQTRRTVFPLLLELARRGAACFIVEPVSAAGVDRRLGAPVVRAGDSRRMALRHIEAASPPSARP
jgi:hypothetical protein